MNWYKISQNLDQKVKFVRRIFAELEKVFGVNRQESREGYLLNCSIEKQDEASPLGTSYTQVAHSKDRDGFYVETYYENEFVQDEYGKNEIISCDYVDVNSCLASILSAIKRTQSIH